jgi:thiamine kinase-like enzyme
LDAWPENFIKGKDKVYLIDWEYSCNYDKLWDVASIGLECEYSKDETELFYNKYFGRKPTEKEIKKMDVLRILMDIYWSMWSLSETSLGEDLYDYSFGRYSRAVANFNALHNDKCHEE